MKKKSRIKCEPLRLFRYSLDGGRSWLTVASAVRDDTVSAVRRGLETQHGFPVMVRAAVGIERSLDGRRREKKHPGKPRRVREDFKMSSCPLRRRQHE